VEAGKAYFFAAGENALGNEKPKEACFWWTENMCGFMPRTITLPLAMPAKKSDDWRTPIAFLTTGMKLARTALYGAGDGC